MKKILITGANSYLGVSFENFIKENYPGEYQIDTVDMIDGSWREKSFAGYDAIYHVSGIAHQKETKKNARCYFEINRDLAVETAKKAKTDGVGQFVYLSSMNVYGMETGVITQDTLPNPKSNYGISKLQAEEELAKLRDENFNIAILRPPMVYGYGCKGNFQTVIKLVKKSPCFPRLHNERSLIHVDNLSSFVKLAVDLSLSGLYFPHDREGTSTQSIARVAAESMGKRIHFSRLLGLGVAVLRLFVPMVKKAFGTLVYQNVENFDFSYCVIDCCEALKKSVGEKE